MLDLPHQASLQISTDLHALTELLVWFDQFKHAKIPNDVWLQCQLALAEGFTNAVRHAHKGYPIETAIDIEVKATSHCIEIRIWDNGSGFDLVQALSQLPPKVSQEAEGGRGLMLMRRIADTLTYTRTPDNRNCLHLIKKF